jgi:hypothetical protein
MSAKGTPNLYLRSIAPSIFWRRLRSPYDVSLLCPMREERELREESV